MGKMVHSLMEFEAEAAAFARNLTPRAESATLVTLSGELGAGKTAFVKAAAKTLGVTDDLTSPTFVLMKNYPLTEQNFNKLVHIDAYRLESGAELAPLHLTEVLADSRNLVMLEWPEKVADILPAATTSIHIVPNTDGSRTITYA